MKRRWPWLVASLLAGVVVTGAGFATTGRDAEPAAALGPGDVTVEMRVDHSLFDTTEIRVVQGSA